MNNNCCEVFFSDFIAEIFEFYITESEEVVIGFADMFFTVADE